MSATANLDQVKAELHASFPGWNMIHTDRGRWWATRQPEKDDCGRLVEHSVTAVEADTADQLRAELERVTRR